MADSYCPSAGGDKRTSNTFSHQLAAPNNLASAKDPRLMLEMQRMYGSIPDQPYVDGNLVVLPATQSEGLYGDAVSEHHQRVTQFFTSRLVN